MLGARLLQVNRNCGVYRIAAWSFCVTQVVELVAQQSDAEMVVTGLKALGRCIEDAIAIDGINFLIGVRRSFAFNGSILFILESVVMTW